MAPDLPLDAQDRITRVASQTFPLGWRSTGAQKRCLQNYLCSTLERTVLQGSEQEQHIQREFDANRLEILKHRSTHHMGVVPVCAVF